MYRFFKTACVIMLSVALLFTMTPMNAIAEDGSVQEQTQTQEKKETEKKSEPEKKETTKATEKQESSDKSGSDSDSGNFDSGDQGGGSDVDKASGADSGSDTEANKDEEQKASTDAAEKDKEDAEKDKDKYPAQTLTANAGGVKVTLKAPEGSLPEGSKLKAKQVGQKYINAVENTLEAQGRTLSDAVAIDVTPVNKDGKAIQPKKSVSVTFSGAGLDLESGDSVSVYRVSDDASSVTNVGGGGSANSQSFSANHFTIYVAGGSQTDPVGQTTENRYELAYGETVELATSHGSDNVSYWSVTAGGQHVTFNASTKVVKNVNETDQPQEVTIYWERTRYGQTLREYFYILAKPKEHYHADFMLQDAGQTGFTNIHTSEVSSEGEVTDIPSEDPEKTYQGNTYVFSGWCNDEDCTDPATYTGLTANKQYYGKYTLKEYEVTFMFQDYNKTSPEQEGNVHKVKSGEDVTDPPEHDEIIEAGGNFYKFTGWCTDENYGTEADLTNIQDDMTVYGKYEPAETATLTYHAAETDATVPAAVTVPLGTEVTISGNAHYDGHGLVCWNTDPDLTTGTDYAPGDKVSLDAPMDLYAKWDEEDISIIYYRNYETSDTEVLYTQSADGDSTVALLANIPTREHYLFRGWSTSAGGDVVYKPAQSVTIGSTDLKLYAVWGKFAKEDYDLEIDSLTMVDHPAEVPYKGSEYSYEGIVETDCDRQGTRKYGERGYVKIAQIRLTDTEHNIYAKFSDIKVSGKNTGTYSAPLTAGVYTHDQSDDSFVFLGDYIPVNNTELTITPLDVTISTGSDEKLYDGDPLTADGTARFGGGSQTVKHAGGAITLVENETLNVRTTGSQTAPGSSANNYEVAWGDPSTAWGGDFDASTALKRNYNIIRGNIGVLTVYVNHVMFEKNAGEDEVGNMPDNADSGAKYDIPENVPTRENYTFTGWNTKADGSGASYQPKDEYTFPGTEKEVTFYAQWRKDPSLTYDPNGGTFRGKETPTVEYYKPGAIVKIAEAATRKGYIFKGWKTTIEGQERIYQPGQETELPGDVVFKAIWESNQAKIIYNPNGGVFRGKTAPTTIEYELGETITIAEAPTREGYTFLYWKGSEYYPGDTYKVEDDVHLFVAQWEKDTPEKDKKNKKKKKSPKTGDDFQLGYGLLMILAIVAACGLLWRRRREQ